MSEDTLEEPIAAFRRQVADLVVAVDLYCAVLQPRRPPPHPTDGAPLRWQTRRRQTRRTTPIAPWLFGLGAPLVVLVLSAPLWAAGPALLRPGAAPRPSYATPDGHSTPDGRLVPPAPDAPTLAGAAGPETEQAPADVPPSADPGPADGPAAPAVPLSMTALIHTVAARAGLDGERLVRIARCESGLDPAATNAKDGSLGLFQFQPDTWRWASPLVGHAGSSPMDPVANTEVAVYLMARGEFWRWTCA